MKKAMKSWNKLILGGAGMLTAAGWLCGYTTLRLPPKLRTGKIRVACVGDSLSYGCGMPLFFLRRYPAMLGRLLGPDYQVAAFAVNDRTLQDSGNKPFRRERAYPQSKAFQPDIVVLLLGTNDSKNRNWVAPEAFRRQYRALIAAYRALFSGPRVLVCTPPAAFPAVTPLIDRMTEINPSRIPEIAGEAAAAAEQEGVELVDLYGQTKGRRELFGPDGLHFSVRGAKTVAEAVYERIINP